MRNRITFLIIIILLVFFSCKNKTNDYAKIEYKNEINFGKIKVFDTVLKKIKLKNVSSNLLIIKKLETSCGCTVVELNDSIIEPNNFAEIKVEFISDKSNIGKINKSIIIDANTKPNFTVLYLKGFVE
ncbi:DUF1573 domain-containing protein [Flavobacterium sp.]|uniref:DUF1573 domain-containing protein n=1 Tax=Flavobacterium sp. TaxID=239 RepID=UPI003752A610